MTKKKSPDFHVLAGSFRADRHSKTKLQFSPATSTAPRYLSKIAKQEWNRVAPMLLEQGLLTEADISNLAVYCASYAGYRESLELIAKEGYVVSIESQTRTGRTSKPIRNPRLTVMHEFARSMQGAAAKFGFSPFDREKLQGNELTDQTPPDADDDEDYSDLYVTKIFLN